MPSKKTRHKQRRILWISDTHCGHVCGLTPPEWWDAIPAGKLRDIARRGWEWYLDFLKRGGPYDLLVHVGDGIDGRGLRSDGREVIAQPEDQCEMLLSVIGAARCDRIAIVEGTPYHTSDGAQWESVAASRLRDRGNTVDFGERLTITVNGRIFDARHKVGGSQAPTGGDAALRSEIVRSAEWSAEYGYPVPHEIVRGHVHRERVVGGGLRWARSLPALQMWTGYGARECGALYHWGATICDVDATGSARWHSEIRALRSESITPHLAV
jgi:hypothetical protein